MSEDDRFLQAMIGYGVWQAAAAARQQAEYQRQQLNLLRKHQGLPPIPPDPPSHLFATTVLLSAWCVAIGVGIALGVAVHELGGPAVHSWLLGLGATWWLCGAARRLFARHVERSDAAFYDSWRRAGCP